MPLRLPPERRPRTDAVPLIVHEQTLIYLEKTGMRIRPYKAADADTILSWCREERAFYRWTAGILGSYPITPKEFCAVEALMPFTAFDETGVLGFFTLRAPNGSLEELRFGFVIVDPDKRGKGCGKEMLRLGLRFVFELYGAKRATLGVFENNLPAYHCYKAVGFCDVVPDAAESYHVLGEEWTCRELAMEKTQFPVPIVV